MESFRRLFTHNSSTIIGMVHVQALPGTPKHIAPMASIIEKAAQEARLYKQAGVDAIMVENMHDRPYVMSDSIGPEITASMATVCKEVKSEVGALPVGVQVLAGGNRHALAVAKAAGLQFIRAEGFVFAHVADEGWMQSCAGDLLRYRQQIGAQDVLVFTDIKKKHSSHAVTQDISLEETAHAAEFFCSDGVIVTGTATGQAPELRDLQEVMAATSLPVLVGSGVTTDNLPLFIRAHALIIGSHFKHDGRWENDIDSQRLVQFMEAVNKLRIENTESQR